MHSRVQQLRADRDAGFTLIELLVVVAIIGILAAIAIPVFLNQRANAARSALESEMKGAATSLEVYMTENGSYPASAALAVSDANVKVSENAAIAYTYDADTGTYTLVGCVVNNGTVSTDDADKRSWPSTNGTFDATPAGTCGSAAGLS